MRTTGIILRVAVGVALLALAVAGQSWLGLLGVVPLVSALFLRSCPVDTRRGIGAGSLVARATEKVLGHVPTGFSPGELASAATVGVRSAWRRRRAARADRYP